MLKDYYHILQLPSHATLQEIKQAYRRLAKLYHPDKNLDDTYKSAQFSDIKEAYEVLTNPVKKEIYLQERWYNQSINKKRTSEAVTPVSILKLSIELEKYVSKLDIHRMNKEGLRDYINEFLSADTIEKLKQFHETEINRQIIIIILAAVNSLPFEFVKQVAAGLKKLAGKDETALQQINDSLLRHKKNLLWGKYKIALVLLFTILICFLIYLANK